MKNTISKIMERNTFICSHLNINELTNNLVNYLKVNGFEINKLPTSTELYFVNNGKTTFSISIETYKEDITVSFEYCDGNKEQFSKKFSDAEKLFSTEKDPEKNIGALEALMIYYDK
jgi:hypothetical protein